MIEIMSLHQESMKEKVSRYGHNIVRLHEEEGLEFKQISRRYGKFDDWSRLIYVATKKGHV